MCSAFAKRLWLGVLLVTITSARPTLQGTELKKKMKSKMWFNVMKFLWLLLAFNPLYLIYIPNVVKYMCDDLNTNFNKLYNWSIVTSVDQFNEATCIMSMFTILRILYLLSLTFIQVLFNKYVIVLFLHDIVCKYLLTKWFFFLNNRVRKRMQLVLWTLFGAQITYLGIYA